MLHYLDMSFVTDDELGNGVAATITYGRNWVGFFADCNRGTNWPTSSRAV